MGKAFVTILRLIAAMLLAVGASAPACARTPVETCVFRIDPANGGAGGLIAQAGKSACARHQADLGSGDFGVRLTFSPQVSDPADPLVLRHSNVWQDAERIVLRYADGSTSELAWDSATAARHMMIGAMFEFPVPPRAAPLTGAYVEIKGSANWRGVLLGASLERRSEAEREEHWLIALYAAFAGLTVALLAYNIALWTALKYRFQLDYCAMVGWLQLYTFMSSGAVLLLFPGIDNHDRMRANYVVLVLAGLAAFRFILSYLGPQILAPWLRRAVSVMGLVTLTIALAFAVLAPRGGKLLDTAYFAAGALWLSLLAPILFQAWQARVRHYGLFVLAWSAPVLASLIRAAHGLGLIEYNFWLDNGNMIALSIEALISTLLIVARLRDLSTERDHARAGEQTALRLANSDPLTGLLNRRAFLNLAIGRTQVHRLMLIDIDHFKTINDRIGHDSGDDVLRTLAQAMQRIRPNGSLAVRLGGEEFALLVPMARHSECAPDAILQAVRECPMPLGIRVTVSLGYAEGRLTSQEDWKRLYRLADAALYRAKADGRDRACRATDFGSGAPALAG